MSCMNRRHAHPKVIAHHDDALHALAVALPQSLGQFRVLFSPLGVQPLLELVEDDEHLLGLVQALALAQGGKGPRQIQVGGQVGTPFAQAPQQPGLRVFGGRLDVNREDTVAQPGQAARP